MHLNGGRGRPMKRLSVQEESAEILRLKEVRKEENLGIFQKSTREKSLIRNLIRYGSVQRDFSLLENFSSFLD